MATSNSRDVTLTLSVDTVGTDGIKQLQAQFEALAREGSSAGPEFKQLADQIARLGDQSQALTAFKELAATTDELRASQAAAGFAIDATATKLTELKNASAQAAQNQKDAAAAVIAGQKAYIDLGTQIKILKADYDSAGKQTEEYRRQLAGLTESQAEVKKGSIDLQAAQRAANNEVKLADEGLRKLSDEYNRQAIALETNATALRKQETALQASRSGIQALGVAIDTTAAAEQQLVAVFNQGTAAIEQSQAATRVLAGFQAAFTKELELQAAAVARVTAEEQKLAAAQQAAASATAAATAQTAAATKAAADQISNAFRTVGVRSAEELKAEILQVRAAMDTLKATSGSTGAALDGAFSAGNAKVKSLERDLRELNGTLTLGDKAAKLFSNSMGQIAAGNIVADGVGYLVNKVKELGREFIAVIVQGDQLRRGLNAIYKDTTITTQQMDFLRKSSQESGIAFGGLSQEFLKFSAAMKGANIPLAESNALFKAVTAASASLGLGAEATAGTLNALSQMASKGVVSLEELRAQLGDRLPGAMGLAAKGLGITEAQLIKLVESGQLATRDFIVPFTKALGDLKGEADGLVPTFERLKGALQTSATGFGEAGGVTLFTGALKVLGAIVATVVGSLSGLAEALFLVGAGVTSLIGRLSGNKEAFGFFEEQVNKSATRLREMRQAFVVMIDPAKAVTAAVSASAVTMSVATVNAVKLINANTELSASQKLAALSAALAADATLDAAAKIVQYNTAAGELLKLQGVQVESYQKLAKAAKDQGDTLVALAKISGDQTAIAKASSDAADLYADALRRVSVAQKDELDMLLAQKAEIIANNNERKLSVEQIKVQVDALDIKIKKSQAETEQSLQATAAAEQEAKARFLVIETLGDQSAKVDEYKNTLKSLQQTLADYEELLKQGLVTEEQVKIVREQVAFATAKLADAQADLLVKTRQENEFKRDSLKVTQDVLSGEIALYQAKANVARASGDLKTAFELEMKAKEAKLQIDRIGIQIKEIELQLERAEIALKLEKLKLEEPENTLKRQKLELELKLNDMRTKSLDSSKTLLDMTERELRNQRLLNTTYGEQSGIRDANTGAIDRQTTALDRQSAAIERNNAANEKAIDLENKRLNQDREHFATDKNGQRINAGGDLNTATGILNFLQQAGVKDEARAREITKEFLDSQGNVQYSNNPGQIRYGGSTISDALLKAAERVTFGVPGGGQSQGFGGAGAGYGAPQPNVPGAAPTPQPTYTPPGAAPSQAAPPAAPRTTNVTINLASGVNISSRKGVEDLARTLMPAIEGLQRKGFSAG